MKLAKLGLTTQRSRWARQHRVDGVSQDRAVIESDDDFLGNECVGVGIIVLFHPHLEGKGIGLRVGQRIPSEMHRVKGAVLEYFGQDKRHTQARVIRRGSVHSRSIDQMIEQRRASHDNFGHIGDRKTRLLSQEAQAFDPAMGRAPAWVWLVTELSEAPPLAKSLHRGLEIPFGFEER